MMRDLRPGDRVPMAGTPPPDDRTYLPFLLAGLALALGGGFLLAVVAPLSATGRLPFEDRAHLLIQAHAWSQLIGFAGVIVAGMALRLIPRFAGAPAPGGTLPFLALGLLASSALLRIVFQPWVDGTAGDAGVLVAGAAGSLGMVLVAVLLARVLISGKKKKAEPWRDFVRAGIGWWLVWAVLSMTAALRAVDSGRFVPVRFEDGMAWVAMLGVIGSFVWAVQSRSVPVFFGRKPPPRSRTFIPFVLFNSGLVLLAASIFLDDGTVTWRIEGLGLLLVGGAITWLAPVAGSVWGRAKRLRPRARGAARYVVAANMAAVAAGLLLVWAGVETMLDGEFAAFWARDAARHSFALGPITMLIVGMAQLVAPAFALERADSTRTRVRDEVMFWLFAAALLTRVWAGLLTEVTDYESRMNHSAYAGMLAWAGLAIFAWRLVAAIRKEPEMKALLGFAQ